MRVRQHLLLEAKRAVVNTLCLAMALSGALMEGVPTFAQNQNTQYVQYSNTASDLARENQSRVAASAADIKPILLKDTGLMVELKRWIAKDASDQGQIVTDADLTN